MEHKKIPIDKIRINEKNVKKPPLDLKLEQLAKSIKSIGLLELIAVSYDKKTDDYVIVDGNRRLLALRQLNEDGKFDEVDCVIITADDMEVYNKILNGKPFPYFLKESMNQLPLTEADRAKAIRDLWNLYNDYNIVKEKFGITKEEVDKYVKLSRTPKDLQDHLDPKKIPLEEIITFYGYPAHTDSGWPKPDSGVGVLAENIAQNGLLEPITVYQNPATGKYVILAGLRRYYAYVELNKKHPGEGWDKIPAIVRDDDGETGTPTMEIK